MPAYLPAPIPIESRGLSTTRATTASNTSAIPSRANAIRVRRDRAIHTRGFLKLCVRELPAIYSSKNPAAVQASSPVNHEKNLPAIVIEELVENLKKLSFPFANLHRPATAQKSER